MSPARFCGASREVGPFSFMSFGKGLSYDSFIALVAGKIGEGTPWLS